MDHYETIRLEFDGNHAELILDRADVLNALDLRMAEELCDALGRIAATEQVRAVLLRGEGRAFCAGGNLREMQRALTGDPAAFFDAPLRKIHESALALADLPLPVVGAIHGFASGAGFNLALCCDLLVCGQQTRFNQAFVRIGVVPDTGGTFLLPHRIGSARARELFLLGEFVDAEQALALGLVQRVVPEAALLGAARELTRRLADGPTRAYAEIKQLLRGSAASSLAEALDAEREAQLRIASTGDFAEGVRAFAEKRPPRFEGR